MEHASMPLGMAIGKMMHQFLRLLKKRLSEQTDITITLEQMGLLHLLMESKEDLIQKDMASCMGKDKSTVLRIIDSLEAKELVRRVVDLKDRRKNYLMVTKKGEKVMEMFKTIHDNVAQEITKGINKEELEIFYKVLHQLETASASLL
mgnify:CR=1 FL=1